jgi:D-sedoheptulose 7-phosphate isomerase
MKQDCASTAQRVCNIHSNQPGARGYFALHARLVEELPYSMIDQVAEELLSAYEEGRSVFLFGNGGSAALASHLACDLGKGTINDRNGSKRFRVVALTDNIPLITAWANDSCYEDVFAEQLRNLSNPGDIAFAISGSGNSPNVLCALATAKASGCTTIGVAGYSGGKMKALCDHCIVIPSDNMQIIEDFHLSVSHALFAHVCNSIGKFPRLAAAAGFAAQSD